jgi:hypothetical protein
VTLDISWDRIITHRYRPAMLDELDTLVRPNAPRQTVQLWREVAGLSYDVDDGAAADRVLKELLDGSRSAGI